MSLVAYPDSDDEDNDEDNNDNSINNPRLDPTANVLSIATTTTTTTTTQHTSATTAVKRPHHELNDLPPLPAAFHDLYSTNARISTTDNPSLHGGRKRAVPHIEGNWPSHVYLEWLPSQTEASQLHNLIRAIQDGIARANKAHAKPLPVPDIIPSLQSELGTPLPLHISLSRTLQIRTEQRDNFLQTLTSCLRRAAVQAVQIRFAGLKWVPNYQGNRWFLVLSIERPPQDELNRLLEACNEAAERCGHPGLYIGGRGDGPMQGNVSPNSTNKRRKDTQHQGDKNSTQQTIDRTDNFHITIAWNLADPTPEWTSLVQHMDVSQYIQSPDATFDAVKAKVGNVIHKVDLGQKKSGLGKGGGILGLG